MAFAVRSLLAEAGVADVITEADQEAGVEEFRRFLDDVDPDDFRE